MVAVSYLVKDVDTEYSRIIISNTTINGRPARVLQNDRGYTQSGEYLDKSGDLAFPYIQAFAYLAKLRPESSRSLIIGGGAYTMTGYLARTYPNQRVDTVEIDPKLLNLSQKYFNF